jgi:hypothetical protein
MAMANLGDDAKMLIRRAKKHYDEFKQYRDGHIMGPMWDIRHRQVEGGHAYRLVLNRPMFVEMKPIVADLANNVIHSLDLLVGDLARAGGADRNYTTKFPWIEQDVDFQGALRGLSKVIGPRATGAINGVRNKWSPHLKHVHAMETVSNLSKHWELVPTTAGAAAVAWRVPGGQKIWELSKDAFANADEHEFPTVPKPFEGACQLLVSFKFAGLGEGFDPTPETVIDYAMQYAEEIIAAVEQVGLQVSAPMPV